MKNYLVISTVGDESLHHEWIENNPNFDLVLLYYGDSDTVVKEYAQQTPYVYMAKGEKYHLLKSLILSFPEFISNYKYVWLPDNDVSISTENINKMFEIANKYELYNKDEKIGYFDVQLKKVKIYFILNNLDLTFNAGNSKINNQNLQIIENNL